VRGHAHPPRDARPAVALAGLGLTTMGFAGMFLAGGRISPGLATVLANTQPLIAAALATFVLGERVRGRVLVAMLFGLAGIVLVAATSLTTPAHSVTGLGVGFVMLGAVGVAAGNVALKHASSRVDPVMAGAWQLLIGSAPLVVLGLLVEDPRAIAWSVDFAIALGVLAIAGTAVAFALWIALLARNELVRLNVFSFATPIFGLAIAAVFYDERLGAFEWGGVALVLCAVIVIATRPRSSTTPRAPSCDR
jgi:drug/metabolite transporter (DMT)-like permease